MGGVCAEDAGAAADVDGEVAAGSGSSIGEVLEASGLGGLGHVGGDDGELEVDVCAGEVLDEGLEVGAEALLFFAHGA